MQNASPSSPRPPSRVPRRGLAALVLTAAGVTLVFSFKTPAELISDTTAFPAAPGDENAPIPLGPGSDTADAAVPPGLPDGGAAANRRASEAPAGELRGAAPATDTPPAASRTARAPQATRPPKRVPAPTPAAPSVLTGQVVRTPYGPVQVEITLDGTAISDIQALRLPSDRPYSRRISEVVEPMLRQEVLQAQSSRIHLISGATYTSTGYAMSLQSALDQAPAAIRAPA
jgi:uncharacterized protein with FMN-binding domain